MKEQVATEVLTTLFRQLKIKATVKSCIKKNSFLMFDIALNSGGTFRKLKRSSTEIALALKSLSEPFIYPITENGIIRIEVLISKPKTIFFRDMMNIAPITSMKLPLVLGKSYSGTDIIADLARMPHLLVGGATGFGKSITLHVIINNLLLNSRRFINFALIDTKRVEFSYYKSLSQLYGTIANDVSSSISLLESLVIEMENRFAKLEKSNSRDINSYKRNMPYIVVVIDELADLMTTNKKKTQGLICRLAQKSRACGIHLVIATQRPSVDVVTGLIKANFPSRLSCRVSSAVDSRILLDNNGAECLYGNGDSIINCAEFSFTRFKASYVSSEEIEKMVNLRKAWWRRIWNS
jgi:S-DNA-T family DNA segregation ATPase FtsK/SpoIIIE